MGNCAPRRRLDHVQIAVGVAGVEGLDRDGDEEVAPAGVADAFTAGCVADAVDLVHGMRHVVAERALVGDPGRIGLRERRMRRKKGRESQERGD